MLRCGAGAGPGLCSRTAGAVCGVPAAPWRPQQLLGHGAPSRPRGPRDGDPARVELGDLGWGQGAAAALPSHLPSAPCSLKDALLHLPSAPLLPLGQPQAGLGQAFVPGANLQPLFPVLNLSPSSISLLTHIQLLVPCCSLTSKDCLFFLLQTHQRASGSVPHQGRVRVGEGCFHRAFGCQKD